MQKSRRKFIRESVLAASSFYIVPRHVLGKGYISPSDKLNIAAIGAGGKGYSDIVNASLNGQNNVVALCDIDNQMLKKASITFPNARIYNDFRVLFDKEKDIDAVTISTPDHTHAVATLQAMRRGIHVYVQKPLTHNIYEARLLAQEARAHNIVTQMGNQGASNPSLDVMKNWIINQEIGIIEKVYVWTNRPVWPQGISMPKDHHDVPSGVHWDAWIGPAQPVSYHPSYHPFKWRGWWAFGTGALGDMGCHLIDAPYRLLGLHHPTQVECSIGAVYTRDWVAEYTPESCPPSSIIHLKFNRTPLNNADIHMTWFDGGLRPPLPEGISSDVVLGDEDGSNGVVMIGRKGIITCGVYGINPKIVFYDGSINAPTIDSPHLDLPEFGHHKAWIEAVKSGYGSPEHMRLTSSFDYAGPMTETVLMGNLAIRSYTIRHAKTNGGYTYPGRKVLHWDGNNMKITNFDEANTFVSRAYRPGWSLD